MSTGEPEDIQVTGIPGIGAKLASLIALTESTDALMSFYIPDTGEGWSIPSGDQVLTASSSRSEVLLQASSVFSLASEPESSIAEAITIVG